MPFTSIACWNCSCSFCSCSASCNELAVIRPAFSIDSPLRIHPSTWNRWTYHVIHVTMLNTNCIYLFLHIISWTASHGSHWIIVLLAQLCRKGTLNTVCRRTSVWLSVHNCRGGNEQSRSWLLPIKLMMQSSSGSCLPASSTKHVIFGLLERILHASDISDTNMLKGAQINENLWSQTKT